MNWQRTAHRRHREGTFRSRVEMLEKRLCLSCTVFQDGATLYISGDNTANHVAVLQNDAGFQVACDGGAPTTFRGIEQAIIHMGRGDDNVEVAYGTGIYRPADFQVHLGAGDDTLDLRANWKDASDNGGSVKFDFWSGAGDDRVTAFLPYIEQRLQFKGNLGAGNDTFSGTIVPPSDLAAANGGVWTVAVLGQQGDDHMNLMLGVPDTGPVPHLINTNLDVMFDGGAGMDNISFITFGGSVAVGGAMHVGVDGGAGPDEVGIIIDYRTATPSGSESIDVDGGSGADRVGIIVDYRTATVDASLSVNVDGGSGDDDLMFDTASGLSLEPHLINGDLKVDLDGGAGNDRELFHIGANTWAGNVAFTASGGAGADEVGIIIDGCTVAAGATLSVGVDSGSGDDNVRGGFGFDPESRGVIAIIFQGSGGDDNLTLDISGIGDLGLLSALVDGGPGFDVAHVTRNVDVARCEMVVFL